MPPTLIANKNINPLRIEEVSKNVLKPQVVPTKGEEQELSYTHTQLENQHSLFLKINRQRLAVTVEYSLCRSDSNSD